LTLRLFALSPFATAQQQSDSSANALCAFLAVLLISEDEQHGPCFSDNTY